MKIKTRYHGDVEIEESSIIHFENGIPGFPKEKSFVIMPLPEESVYKILQSTKSSGLSFIITNPFHFFKDYDFTIEKSILEVLELEKEENVEVYVILSLHETFENSTANLQAPIIINRANKKAKQIIINDSAYTTKHHFLKPQNAGEKG